MRDNNKSFIELFQSLSEGQKNVNKSFLECMSDNNKSLTELCLSLSKGQENVNKSFLDGQKLLASIVFPQAVVEEGTPPSSSTGQTADGADQGAGI